MADLTVNHVFPTPLDLTVHVTGDPSPEEDLIQFYIQGPWRDNTIVTVMFIESFPGFTQRFERVIRVQSKKQAKKSGLGKIAEVDDDVIALLNNDMFNSLSDTQKVNDTISEKLWLINNSDWQLVSIPKTSFFNVFDADFATINQLRFIFTSVNPNKEINISGISLFGGGKDNAGVVTPVTGGNGNAGNGGMFGTYKYRATFFNSVTGNRSNAGESIQVAQEVDRGYVALSGLPVSADPQVTEVEIWRTLGDGVRFFKIAEVANGVTTFDDEVADYGGLDDTEGVATMQNIELPLDNDAPRASFDGCIIDKLAAFWITNTFGETGRVYFSPLGRPEGEKGFINVSAAGDPLHKLVLHRGQRYAFGEAKVYRIDGDDPYTPREIGGVPGIQFAQRRTVVSAPAGIFYQATDGVRVFDGTIARPVSQTAMGVIFRGESAAALAAFEGIVATFARDEYYISDGTQSIAFNINSQTWREVGFDDITALFYEWDTDIIQGGRATNVQLLEQESVFDDAGAAIPFEFETPAVDFPDDQLLVVRFANIDIDTNGGTVTPTLVHRYGTDTLADMSAAGRSTFEREVEQSYVKPSLRFTGTVSDQVTLFDAQLDIREVELGVTNAKTGKRLTQPGRIVEDATQVAFDVVSAIPALDAALAIPLYTQMHLDINTNGNDVDVKVVGSVETVTLTTINNSTRETLVFDINRVGTLRNVLLVGDFTQRISVFGVELKTRTLPLGINFVGN